MLEAGKQTLSKPIQKKKTVTFGMLEDIYIRYADDDANLIELRLAALCLTLIELRLAALCLTGFYGFFDSMKFQVFGVVT